MEGQILQPIHGTIMLRPCPEAEPDEPTLLFDMEIKIRVALTTEVAPQFFPRSEPITRFTVEDLDLGVSDWRQLAGKTITYTDDDELDASLYLATVHNPVTLHRISFGATHDDSISAQIELEFDFRYVKPRPPEMERTVRVVWDMEFQIIETPDES